MRIQNYSLTLSMQNIDAYFDAVFPMAIPVVFLHAHPDDESFLSAGIMLELISRKRSIIVVYAAAAAVVGELKTLIRQAEAGKACAVLGIESPIFLPFCEPKYDGKLVTSLAAANVDGVVKELQTALQGKIIGGQCIFVSYDVNGGYGNMDHRKVHAIGNAFASRLAGGVSRLLEVTLNRNAVHTWMLSAKVRLHSASLPKLSYWSDIFGTEDGEIDYFFELSIKQLEQKRRALSAHASQLSPNEFPLSLSPKDFTDFFGREYLRESRTAIPPVIR